MVTNKITGGFDCFRTWSKIIVEIVLNIQKQTVSLSNIQTHYISIYLFAIYLRGKINTFSFIFETLILLSYCSHTVLCGSTSV